VLECDAAIPDWVLADPLRLRQVVTNLVGNAVKFTERGHVRLSLRQRDQDMEIAVADTGIGIRPDDLARLFQPFRQVDASTTRRHGGTGLGLSISRQLVELMGGRILVESELGIGSRFIVDLPLPAGQGTERVRERRQTPRLPPLKILAADDVEQNLELLVLNLQRLGHQLITVGDGEAAVEMFTREAFDLVLMDVQMPGTDGLEASRRIRAWEQARQSGPVPIIALTASVLERDRQEALDAGMNGFAGKPLDMPALLAEMASVLGLSNGSSVSVAAASKAKGLFDWTRGARLWGGPLQMAAAIARFLEEQAVAEPLRALLLVPGLADLEARAHRLRGVAANLGLVQLSHTAFSLEQAARAGAAERCAELIDDWHEAFEAVRLALPLQPEAQATAMVSADPQHVRQALDSLIAELERGSLDEAALCVLEQSVQLSGDGVRAVRQAIDDFEFEQALEHLQRIRQQLKQESGA